MKSKNPTDRMGVYHKLSDVPHQHRLARYRDRYEGRDVWAEWAAHVTERNSSQRYAAQLERTERAWKRLAADWERHHALATPAVVEAFATRILERCTPVSAYQIYFTKLEAFYSWLQNHAHHPHVYHPVWMAAAAFESTECIWNAKMERRSV